MNLMHTCRAHFCGHYNDQEKDVSYFIDSENWDKAQEETFTSSWPSPKPEVIQRVLKGKHVKNQVLFLCHYLVEIKSYFYVIIL